MWGVETDAELLLTGFLLVLPKTSRTCTLISFIQRQAYNCVTGRKKNHDGCKFILPRHIPWTYFRRLCSIAKLSYRWRFFFSLILESITNPPTAICIVYYIGFKCSEIASNLVPVSYVSTNGRFWCRHAHHSVFYTSLRWRSAQHSMTTYALTNQNAC